MQKRRGRVKLKMEVNGSSFLGPVLMIPFHSIFIFILFYFAFQGQQENCHSLFLPGFHTESFASSLWMINWRTAVCLGSIKAGVSPLPQRLMQASVLQPN